MHLKIDSLGCSSIRYTDEQFYRFHKACKVRGLPLNRHSNRLYLLYFRFGIRAFGLKGLLGEYVLVL